MTTPSKTTQRPLTILFIAALVMGCLTFSVFTGCSSSSNSSAPSSSGSSSQKAVVKEGQPAPNFTFTTLDGTTAQLSDYQGRVVLLNFWATWCSYCLEEMPDMQKLHEEYPDVVILAVNRGDSKQTATDFAHKETYDFTWALDEKGAIEALYPANGIPYSLIIDKEGTLTQAFNGSAPDMYSRFKKAVVAAGA